MRTAGAGVFPGNLAGTSPTMLGSLAVLGKAPCLGVLGYGFALGASLGLGRGFVDAFTTEPRVGSAAILAASSAALISLTPTPGPWISNLEVSVFFSLSFLGAVVLFDTFTGEGLGTVGAFGAFSALEDSDLLAMGNVSI